MQTEDEDFIFDVFISYSSNDKAWVRGELLECLEQAGLRVCIDYRDFRPGAPILTEIERALDTSRKTLLILTPNYLASGWTTLESLMLQTDDPANRDLRLIPLYKAECELPRRIKPLTPIYFTDTAELTHAWRQLLTALGKPPEPEVPKELQREEWFLAHPYPMPPNFTGREAECDILTRWLGADAAHPLLSLRALGGFGKSALAWHWLTHDIAPTAWPRVVWWSFYEGEASFNHFLAETLDYLSGGKIQPDKLSAKDAIKALLQLLHAPGTLLVLDGFERELRAFGGLNAAYQGDEAAKSETNERDCISPLADLFLYNVALHPNLRSKVLLTTRLCPHVLEAKGGGFLQGCCENELKQMQPGDAVEFFHAQGIRGTHTEIEMACEPYGYHPLSLRLLAGLIVGDFQQPGDIAAAKRLDVSGDLVQRQNHVLKVAYNSLTPAGQALLGRIACFRTPVKYEALKALAETELKAGTQMRKGTKKKKSSASSHPAISALNLDADLRDLVARGLLHHDTKECRFDLHPIVRRYAYDRLAAPDRAAAHTRLRDYFAAVPPLEKVTRLEDLAPVIELYHHTVRAGQYDGACKLLSDRLVPNPLYFQLGAYQLCIDLLRALFPGGEDRPPRLKDESAQAWTLNELANSYSLSGQPGRALPLYEGYIAICEKGGDKTNLAIGLGNVADDQLKIGALQAAEINLRRRIALGREIKDEFWEAAGHQELGRLLAYQGAYAESEAELRVSTDYWTKTENIQGQCLNEAYRALRELLLLRSRPKTGIISPQSAISPGRRALELADEWQKQVGRPNARGCAPPPARRTRPGGWPRRRWSSPSAAGTSCKERILTWSSPNSPSLAATKASRSSTQRKPAASPPATARPITPIKPPTTKPARCWMSWSRSPPVAHPPGWIGRDILSWGWPQRGRR